MRTWLGLLSLLLLTFGCTEAPPEAQEAESPTSRRVLYPEALPEGYPFSPGVLAGDTLYIAGMVGNDPATGEKADGIAAQTRAAFDTIGLVLTEAGLDHSDLVSCHVQLTDMANYQEMNAAYASYFSEGQYPARTTLEVPALVGDAEIEISCIAYAGEGPVQYVRPAEGSTPPAMGPYSPGVLAGGRLYLSGQGGRDPATGETPADPAAQAERTMLTIKAILEAAELDFTNVAFTNLYYLGPENRAAVLDSYSAFFESGAAPSLGAVCLSKLPGDISVEITTIATENDYITRLFPHDEDPKMGYSPASLTNGTLYLSAMAAPEAGDTVEAQMRAILAEHKVRLELADMTFADVAEAKVYLADVADFGAMNAVFREYFPENPPARTTIGVREEGDRAGVKLEIALIAVE